MGKGKGVEKEVEVSADVANKIGIEEYAVIRQPDKYWMDGLVVHAGKEPKTEKEWDKALEEFKNKPVKN